MQVMSSLDINENYSQKDIQEKPQVLLSLQKNFGKRIGNVLRGIQTKEILGKRGKNLITTAVKTGIVAGLSGGLTGCMKVPDLPASAFTVLVDEGKTVQKRTCASYVHFFDEQGVHYSEPGIIFKGMVPPAFGIPYDIADLEVSKQDVFGDGLTDKEVWSILQKLQAESISSGKVPAMHMEDNDIDNIFIETRYNVLVTLYETLRKHFPKSLYDCQDHRPNGAYPQLFIEEFARHHGFFASIDTEVQLNGQGHPQGNVELVIGKKGKDIRITTKEQDRFAVQQIVTADDETLYKEIEHAMLFVDDLLERIPDLRRFLKKPDTIRIQTIVDTQKSTGTGGFFRKDTGIVLYDDSNTQWRPSILLHELVHAYDAEKSDEQAMKTVQHEEREIPEDMPRSARKEFLALALEALYHQKYSSPTDRMRWIWHQLEQKTTPNIYQEFRTAVFTFTKRYLKEYPPDPVEDMITQHDPLNIKYATVYQQDEYWELLGKFMEKLIGQLPLEEEK